MRSLVKLALAFTLALLAPGCATSTPCPLVASSPGAVPFCVLTSDGWAIVGVQWNANATRSVVLVHGLNEDHHSYDAFATELAAQGWRVLAYDSRGLGQSTNQGIYRNFSAEAFQHMDRDLDAVRTLLPVAPRALVGASVGSSEVLRWSDRVDRGVPLVLLSPGLGYQNIPISEANADHTGRALFFASSGDAYSTRSVEQLAPKHPGPKDVRLIDGVLHGTQILQADAERAFVEAWLANATR